MPINGIGAKVCDFCLAADRTWSAAAGRIAHSSHLAPGRGFD